MRVSIITRQQLEIINRKTLKYPLQIAEKDYFLALVMRIISGSAWGEILVFKGGSAVNHCYLEQYRFSEDLDFSSNGINISIEDAREIFTDVPFLTIKKEHLSETTLKIEKLQYTGPLVQPNSLKVEFDVFQNVLLPPQSLKYNNVWGLDFKVRVMDIREICAEKIRAMSDRARYRDFYDLFWIIKIHKIDPAEVVTYVARKEIRTPITRANILRNWRIIGTQKAKEMSQVFYSQKVDNDQINNMIDKLPFTEITSS